MLKSIATHRINGREAVRIDAFGPLNLRLTRPYFLRIIAPNLEDFLDVMRGTDARYYYLTQSLRIGEAFRVARRSSRRREPFYGRLVARDEDVLVVVEISEAEFEKARKK